MKKIILPALILICILSALLTTTRNSQTACFNADEAAFGYNAYSIMKTGGDEYGVKAPLRLRSFGDYKMPLYSYLSIPFIATMGLSETSTRALNMLMSLFLPAIVYLLSRELFEKKSIALLSAGATTTTFGLYMLGRQAHEAYLTTFILLAAFYVYLRAIRLKSMRWWIGLCALLGLALFGYQSTRIMAGFFVAMTFILTLKKHVSWRYFFILLAALAIFSIPDFIYQPARVSNLLFFRSSGFEQQIDEYRFDGGSRVLYNKGTIGAWELLHNHLSYYSPQFLLERGDENYRFGYHNLSIITPVVYLMSILGIYFLFRKKHRGRWIIISALAAIPLGGSLSWAGASLTRTLILLPLLGMTAGYGVFEFAKAQSKNKKVRYALIGSIALMHTALFAWTYNTYMNHYPKRDVTVHAQQCGYRDAVDIVRDRVDRADNVYVSKSNGQPYIFMLFYLQRDPAQYAKSAALSEPDEYGFGQVERDGNIHYNIPEDKIPNNSLIIASEVDFQTHPLLSQIPQDKITKVKRHSSTLFYIYESANK